MVALGLCAIGVLVLGPYVHTGGFANDDWVEQAWAHFGGFGRVFQVLIGGTPRRPLGAVYFGLTHTLLGGHQHWQLALAAAERLAISLGLYAVLRELRLDRLTAAGAAGLALLFPFSDATWLWISGGQVGLAAALWLWGLWSALHALRATRGGCAWRACGLILYVASILLYEIALVAILLSGALYLLCARRGAAVRHWMVDIACTVVVAVFVTSRLIPLWSGTDLHQVQSLSATLQHARLILDQSITLAGRSLVPFGHSGRWALTLSALAILAAAGVVARHTADRRLRGEIVKLLLLAAGGVVATMASWAMITFAAPTEWYVPLVTGLSNRVNVLAGVGLSSLAVALARLVGLLLFRRKAAAPRLVAGLAIVAIGAGYFHRVVNDRVTWTSAESDREAVLSGLHVALGTPRPGTAIIASGFPLWSGPTVPVFATYADLMSATQVMWNDPSIIALPAAPGSIGCHSAGITVADIGPAAEAPYGRTYFVYVPTRRVTLINDVAGCRAVAVRIG